MSDTPRWQYGEIVQLLSGGPPMTLVQLDDFAVCQWFDRVGVMHRDEFHYQALRPYVPRTWVTDFPPVPGVDA